ncbi:MAG: HD domain-containing phosphohydrolase [Gemmatimonadota bacterium]|jgi:HD-GYP domain-containing protein (c-di-GMP phosphodiesterase class II)
MEGKKRAMESVEAEEAPRTKRGDAEDRGDGEVVDVLSRDLRRARHELSQLNKIGMALMSERDLDRLLGSILTQARRLTTSDAGSLYLVEEDAERGTTLHFLRAQNDSLPDLPDPDFTLPLDRSSMAGYVASTGESLVIDDAYHLSGEAPYSFNRGFDEEHGYRGKSMLVVPMRDHKDRILGVLQLINRKDRPDASIRGEADAAEHVLPYGDREVQLVQSLAGQAAVSIENGRLYRDIEELFEGFITAAVTAIDQRDPATSGHSVRVTEMACGLAEAVGARKEGRFAEVSFSRSEMRQLRYACLLHDFGKVGVREEILTKGAKVPPVKWERLSARFERARTARRLAFERRRRGRLEMHGEEGYREWLDGARRKVERELEQLDRYWEAVVDANVPRIFARKDDPILEEIHETTIPEPGGAEIELLTVEELEYLRIARGSLSEDEIRQIRSHVIHSYDFLRNIPWTDELSRIDEIVRGHHERLDGGGYPDGIAGEEISLETRMLTVADIFDALTASDRPYKRALTVQEALEILRAEAASGTVDADLVGVFIDDEVYQRVLERDWREFL